MKQYLELLDYVKSRGVRKDDHSGGGTDRVKSPPDSLFAFRYKDFELVGYNPYPAIRASVAV